MLLLKDQEQEYQWQMNKNLKIIDNFLSEMECIELIKKFKEFNGKYQIFKKRYLLELLQYPNESLFHKTINKYKLNNKKIKNIELLFWPVGESHDWHDDAADYDYTTITYLNEGYIGGRTIVKNNNEDIEIEPKTGKYVAFESNAKHKVTELLKGERFLIICWYSNESK
jgi:hypothetical protein